MHMIITFGPDWRLLKAASSRAQWFSASLRDCAFGGAGVGMRRLYSPGLCTRLVYILSSVQNKNDRKRLYKSWAYPKIQTSLLDSQIPLKKGRLVVDQAHPLILTCSLRSSFPVKEPVATLQHQEGPGKDSTPHPMIFISSHTRDIDSWCFLKFMQCSLQIQIEEKLPRPLL